MKRFIAVLFVAGFMAAGALVATAADKGQETVKYETKMGAVTFEHQAHQTRVEDCTTCHHAGVEAGKCSTCHDVDPAAPKQKDAFHKLCKDCHKDKGGPTGCKDCHKK
jgi:hypothetical protein